jgi:hypothetical protein
MRRNVWCVSVGPNLWSKRYLRRLCSKLHRVDLRIERVRRLLRHVRVGAIVFKRSLRDCAL